MYYGLEYKYHKRCLFCGRTFGANNPKKKYCSKTCANHKNIAPEKPQMECPVCHKMFSPKTKRSKACSYSCTYKLAKAKRYFDIDEITWKNLREMLIEKADYRCVDCNKFAMGEGLEVHHIKPIFKGGSNNVKNLVVLCSDCHVERHKNIK